MRINHAILVLAFITGSYPMTAWSDEGMWLLDEPPRELLKKKYNFELTPEWLEHARLASIRFNNGGSGSFVSPDGLIITNHHVGADSVQKLGAVDKNLLRDGFYAKTQADELKCPDLELNVLHEIVDVTEKVNAAVKPNMPPAAAFAARRAAMSALEKEASERTKQRCDVVTLYQGGAYHLYHYKKYTDIRLVFAPEQAIASFGGDVDNFEFPRYNLDISLFRAYENGKPVKLKHYLTFSETGPTENDVVFVTGHPGTTNRLETYDKLKHRRDFTLPYTLARLRAMEAVLLQYSERGPEQRRQAATDLHSFANARKAYNGQYQGLLDPEIMKTKQTQEANLLELIRKQSDPDKGDEMAYRKAIERIADIEKVYSTFEKEYSLFETGQAFSSEYFTIARHIVRLANEAGKPNADRLREYRDSNLESLKFQLFSPAPIYPELQRVRLLQSISFLVEQLGSEHPLVMKTLAGKSPAKLVDELLTTKLGDPNLRKQLVEGGAKAVDDCRDPMIVFARTVDGEARKLRKRFEEEVEEPERQAYGELSKLRFKVLGRTVAPDATFTLRLAFGVVKGYRVDGMDLPYHTTFGAMFERAEKLGYREPFDLPKRWLAGKERLDPKTPFNFVSTADTIGGNSGSPVLNRAGEFVGINFDRNRHGLVRNFIYTEVQARHIAVHSRGILEALRKLYDCPSLVKELTGK